MEQNILVSDCLICSTEIALENDVEIGEIIECYDCGTEHEVSSIDPIIIKEAPTTSEDWGQ